MRTDYSELDRRITIEKDVKVLDRQGNEPHTWSSYYSCAAGVKPFDEYVQTEERRPDYNTVTEFKVRYCEKTKQIVPETYRVIYGGTVHRILSAVDVNGAHELIKIKAVIDSGKAI